VNGCVSERVFTTTTTCLTIGLGTYKMYMSALSTVSPAPGLETGPQYVPM